MSYAFTLDSFPAWLCYRGRYLALILVACAIAVRRLAASIDMPGLAAIDLVMLASPNVGKNTLRRLIQRPESAGKRHLTTGHRA